MKKQKTLFEMMVSGDIPCVKIYEDDICLGIVDKFPTTEGQCLVFPKKATDYIFDLDQKTYHHLFEVAKIIGQSIDASFKPERTCMVIEGFEVPHAHIKLYPVHQQPLKISGGTEISDKKMIEVAKKIKNGIDTLMENAER